MTRAPSIQTRVVSEKTVEGHLVKGVKALGGVADKTASLGMRGYFDRVVVLPGGRVFFVETKRPKRGRVSPHQQKRHEDYRALGADVRVIATLEEVQAFLAEACESA